MNEIDDTVEFERTLVHAHLNLREELKLEPAPGGQMFYYRSKWAGRDWSDWGYWATFPRCTTMQVAITFLLKAGWSIKS